MKLLGHALKLVVVIVALVLPVFGAWLASSMAAYANGPRWVAVVVALLGFPIVPGLWELYGRYRRTRRKNTRPPFLTTLDRLWLRTLTVNVLFVSGLLLSKPASGVRALSARGDWMLDGRSGELATSARAGLHRVADGLEWLYARAHRDDTKAGGDGATKEKDDKKPAPLPRVEQVKNDKGPQAVDDAQPPPVPVPAQATTPPAAGATWPLPQALAASVTGLTAAEETSLEDVARALVAKEPTDEGKVKALHDWAADRIAYDVPSYVTRNFAPQDAKAVFERRTAVCAGYAYLLEAMGKAAGLDITTVLGHAKGRSNEVDGAGHAWNKVRFGQRAYLIDVTWDAGIVDGSPLRFEKRYRSDYLFTPPEVFGVDHFPEANADQLREPPISRGDFMRAPQLTPDFFARGLVLTEPTRSQVTVDRLFVALVDTTHARGKQHLLATFEPKEGGQRTNCVVDAGARTQVTCTFPSGGSYRVILFASDTQFGTYQSVGEIDAQDRR